MSTTVEGVFRNGRVELNEELDAVEGARLIVTVEPERRAPRNGHHGPNETSQPRFTASGKSPAPGLPPLPTPEEWRQRMETMRRVFEEWKADESGYDEETWPALKSSLERNREEAGEYRRLFGEGSDHPCQA